MEGGALLDPAFKSIAEKVVLFCHVGSRTPGEPHPDLFAEKAGRSYPYLAFLDPSGALLGSHEAFPVGLEALARSVDAHGKAFAAAPGDREAALDALLLLVEARAVPLEEGERRLAALGDPGARAPRFGLALDRFRFARDGSGYGDLRKLETCERILAQAPDDRDAREAALLAARGLGRGRPAFIHALEGLRHNPDDLRLRGQAADLLLYYFVPEGITLLRSIEKAGDPSLSPWAKERIDGYAPSGGDAWESSAPAAAPDGCDTRVWSAAGKARAAGTAGYEHVVVCRRAGTIDHGFQHSRGPAGSRLTFVCAEGSELVRESKTPWSLQDVESLVAAVHPAVPALVEFVRHRRTSLGPPLREALERGLAADPALAGLQAFRPHLAAVGWDAEAVELDRALPGGGRVRVFRPDGPARPEKGWRDERVAIVRGPDGGFERALVVQSHLGGPAEQHYATLREEAGNLLFGRLPALPSAEEVAAKAVALAGSGDALRRGMDLLAQATRADRVTPELLEAQRLFKTVLREHPTFTEAAHQLVLAYLRQSDRLADPDEADALYPRALGAVQHLEKVAPGHPAAMLATGVFSYRFLNYPGALHFLKGAGQAEQGRAQEILGALAATGQGDYRQAGLWEVDGMTVYAYERARGDAASEKALEGLQLVERCFAGYKDGTYRFTAAYRVQTAGRAVRRELVMNRFEQSFRIRDFDEEPGPDLLRAEVEKALRALSAGK